MLYGMGESHSWTLFSREFPLGSISTKNRAIVINEVIFGGILRRLHEINHTVSDHSN